MTDTDDGDSCTGGSEQYDPLVSVCPECRKDDVEVANGRSGTYYCPNCDGYMGWSRVLRVRRSQYLQADTDQ